MKAFFLHVIEKKSKNNTLRLPNINLNVMYILCFNTLRMFSFLIFFDGYIHAINRKLKK
jgi:hypothetical protein